MSAQTAVTAPPHICTTFAALRAAGACTSGYRTLAQHIRDVYAVTPEDYGLNRPIEVATIAKSNGLSDALWVLRNATLSNQVEHAKFLRLLACDFAQHVLHIFEAKYPEDLRPRHAIIASRKYAHGQCSLEELSLARRAAAAAYAAAAAAYAAYADAAARLTEKQWQLDWLLTALAAESALCATTFSEGSAEGNEVATA